MNLKTHLSLRKLVKSEVRNVVREDYARGIPDFALQQVASDCAEDLKRQIVRHINLMSSNPSDRRQKVTAACAVVRDLEQKIKELLEDGLQDFLRQT